MSHYTEKDVQNCIENVMTELEGTGWDFLAKQYPLYTDNNMPMAARAGLKAHNTFSCVTKDYVCFSESLCLERLDDWYEKQNMDRYPFGALFYTVKSVLVHEYGHLLMGHLSKPLPKTKIERMAQSITHEIETNRCVLPTYYSDFFKSTALADFQEQWKTTEPFYTYTGIYNEVKRLLSEMTDEQRQRLEDGMPDEEDNSNDGEQDSQPNSKPNLVKSMMEAQEQAQANQDDEQDESTEKGHLLAELGLPQSEAFDNADTPKERLQALVELVENKKVKQALARIKGVLAGETSRDKVGTYSRSSRKTAEDGLLRRGTKKAGNRRPRILIALDESGSMDGTAVKTAATAVKIISKTIGRNRSDVYICSFNDFVNDFRPLDESDEVLERYYPDCGTSFESVVHKAMDNDVDVVLCIGDGEGYLPPIEYLNGTYQNKKYPHWIDILITAKDDSTRIKNAYYQEEDIATGRRETYWLGKNSQRIMGLSD